MRGVDVLSRADGTLLALFESRYWLDRLLAEQPELTLELIEPTVDDVSRAVGSGQATAEAVRRRLEADEVLHDGVVDARLALPERGVPVADVGEQHPLGESLGDSDPRCVRRRRVAGGADHQDGRRTRWRSGGGAARVAPARGRTGRSRSRGLRRDADLACPTALAAARIVSG